MTVISLQADSRGRILLPKDLRQSLGLESKGTVTVEARDDGSVLLRDPRAERTRQLREARGSYAGRGRSVDELIESRRNEAKAESEN